MLRGTNKADIRQDCNECTPNTFASQLSQYILPRYSKMERKNLKHNKTTLSLK